MGIFEHLSPRVGLAFFSVMITNGNFILTVGKGRLSAANNLPTDEEDLAAIQNLSDPSK